MKYIEVPDFHFDPRWAEVSTQCARAVTEAAKANGVDFIALPGDFFNHPIYASDKGGMNTARVIIREWLKICPVVAIEGTPSHDAPGAYGFLEDIGLTLLKIGKYHIIKDTIIFGIPELNKDNVYSSLSVGALEANAAMEQAIAAYCAEYIAPHRALYPSHVAVCLLHGNVTDSHRDNLRDVVLKTSDILIRTEDLRPAMLDRWSLGHIHTPWESAEISAGYAGFTGLDDNPYGKLGFKPAMQLVEIQAPGCKPVLTRIEYGTPTRLKITKPKMFYDHDVAYWLETDDETAEVPSGHPWSRLTRIPKEKTKHTAEITESTSLVDMFRAWDSKAPEAALAKVAEMEKTITAQALEPINVEVANIEIQGGIFWRSRHVKLDLSAQHGITAVRGNNGDGKSSLLAFCTPYPAVVGKDTDSGRPSAIKDFFDQPDSWIRKTVYRNGIEHQHHITIKAAHTKNPKTECYLYIGGINQLATTSWDEMMAKCEELYGPYDDYLITSFYIQPDQSQQRSGLMAAKKIDARNVVQSISGVDRTRENRYALDRKAECEKKAQDKRNWIAGASSFVGSVEEYEASIKENEAILVTLEADKVDCSTLGAALAEVITAWTQASTKSASESSRKQANDAKKKSLEEELLKLNFARQSLESNKKALEEIEAYNRSVIWNRELKLAYEESLQNWAAKRTAARIKIDDENRKNQLQYQDATRAYSQKKQDLERIIKSAQTMSVSACPSCGYVDPEIDAIWKSAQESATEAQAELDSLKGPEAPGMIPYYPEESAPAQPEYLKTDVPFEDETTVRQAIKAAESSAERIAVITATLAELDAATYQIDPLAQVQLDKAKSEYDAMRSRYSAIQSGIAKAMASIEQSNVSIKRIQDQQAKIQAETTAAESLESDATDWGYIARALQPANIPALEIERILSAIDHEATKIVYPFEEGRYTIRTEAADGFDILVHDGETGEETSFFKRNPGHKAFFADAYTKSLIKIRNERFHRSYSPIILDEADAPIHESRIGMYYEMQERYFTGTDSKVLVVSQKDPAYIQHSVHMKELTK